MFGNKNVSSQTASGNSSRLAYFEALFAARGLRALEPRELLLQAARFERIEASFKNKNAGSLTIKRIAVLASQSAQHFMQVLKVFLYENGIAPHFYVAPYNGIASEVLDAGSRLRNFDPDILLLLPATADVGEYPALFADKDDIRQWVEKKACAYTDIWGRLGRDYPKCTILHSLFVIPFARQLGNLESNYLFSKSSCLRQLNMHLIANRSTNVILVDMDYFASFVGKDKWFDEVAYFMSKQPYSLLATKLVASYFSRVMGATIGKIKKCLVVDLDNTVWGGVIGDDGMSGINIDPNNPLGEAYLDFQQYLKDLKDRGVLLAVCSKNDESVARQPFSEHRDMLLKIDDFAAFVANWDDKITNLRSIAKQLNIGLDSLVFFDDNPAERALVEKYEPQVEVIDVPDDPALFVRALEGSFCFEWPQLSKEDMSRAESYAQDRQRLETQGKFLDYDSYLRSLEMEAWIEFTDDQSLPRVAQLINKTNQFNLRTRRYSETMLRDFREKADEYALIQIRLKDKFTNYGIISSLLLRLVNKSVFIENWVMSCRVFNRNVESVAADAIISWAASKSAIRIVGGYIPTQKNSYVANLYEKLGFKPLSSGLLDGIILATEIPYEKPVNVPASGHRLIHVHAASGTATISASVHGPGADKSSS